MQLHPRTTAISNEYIQIILYSSSNSERNIDMQLKYVLLYENPSHTCKLFLRLFWWLKNVEIDNHRAPAKCGSKVTPVKHFKSVLYGFK